MYVDVKLAKPAPGATSLERLAQEGRRAEREGYAAVWSAESSGDPFLPLVPAAQSTGNLMLGTAVAVAFARNPMSLAYTAHHLQLLSGGRLLLGLGSQVRSHIERRFGMPWSNPAPRMREFVEALRAIWTSWQTGAALDFRGEFYTHTLMTPFFAPEPSPWGPPKVYLAALGDRMTEVAGTVCDGLLPHPFTTERFLRERTIPTLAKGLASSARDPAEFSISLSGLVATGSTEQDMARAIAAVRRQIAFYGSTPAYQSVLALHGWEDLGRELTTLSKSADDNRWQRMGDLIDDEVLDTFAVVAEPDRLGAAVRNRFGDLVQRFSFYAPYDHDPAIWLPAVAELNRSR
ncbi:TIGR03617 family F420-dependent LLM class oxidoreductase [Nocardia zapadnayensis]|uniref:TIGR03617 family F420-dependent LLM class oxidoreductase n=1 Tax=Nocardia rhamnosiphila TaxID=426716 RepID=UPI0022483970|nr:TIGR03617 family F420-dependent LLM class oxidoreductase [Nocardia zapadnayensis]MCX0272826.1 TIGR03617 family F420-dependent LLM class oxidoreductase [Nocardia zapadnayensis]